MLSCNTLIDIVPSLIAFCPSGVASISVLQDSTVLAQKSIDNIISVIEGKQVAKLDLMAPVVITKDNVQ